MAATYVALDTATVDTAVAFVTFSSIPATYTDLVLVTNAPSLGGGNNSNGYRFELNGDTGTNYSTTLLSSDSTATPAASREATQTRGRLGFLGQTANTASTGVSHFMNYANATTYKSVISRTATASSNNDANAYVGSSLWRSTAAINAIKLTLSDGSNFPVGTTFSLYGVGSVVAASAAKATGGDTIATDGTYWYHAFRTSGTFTPSTTLTCDILTIAGGGGGADVGYAGGGAGGLVYSAAQSVSATAQTVTVGGGGAVSTNGSNSVFAAITATGGGRAAESFGVGIAGGSGGGGSGNFAGGAASPAGQGNAGGAGDAPGYGGGGGGAGGAGGNAGGGTWGAGGAGSSAYSTWASATGTGVSGVYSRGGNTGTTVNPNSGFGGTAQDIGGTGSGSSGIVIVRYAV